VTLDFFLEFEALRAIILLVCAGLIEEGDHAEAGYGEHGTPKPDEL
jgi:hypothetical protein